MVAISSIHWLRFVGFIGRGGMVVLRISCNAHMSGWLYKCASGCWHVARIALRMLWCIVCCFFHVFCFALGKNPPWARARWGSGGVGFVIHVCSMHSLSESMISLNCGCVFCHCMCVSCSFCSVLVRLVIARLCDSNKVMWSLWRLLGGMGYVIHGFIEGGLVFFMTMILEVSWSMDWVVVRILVDVGYCVAF